MQFLSDIVIKVQNYIDFDFKKIKSFSIGTKI